MLTVGVSRSLLAIPLLTLPLASQGGTKGLKFRHHLGVSWLGLRAEAGFSEQRIGRLLEALRGEELVERWVEG